MMLTLKELFSSQLFMSTLAYTVVLNINISIRMNMKLLMYFKKTNPKVLYTKHVYTCLLISEL